MAQDNPPVNHPPRWGRKTIYNGIEMRSRLEAKYAGWLDRVGARWEHEPCAFASGPVQYLPDFRIRDVIVLDRPRTVYVEVKPTLDHLSRDVLDQMSVIHKSDPDAVLVGEVEDIPNPLVLFPAPLMLPVWHRLAWVRTNEGSIALAWPIRSSWAA